MAQSEEEQRDDAPSGLNGGLEFNLTMEERLSLIINRNSDTFQSAIKDGRRHGGLNSGCLEQWMKWHPEKRFDCSGLELVNSNTETKEK